jgi:hypothetical protein
VPPTIRSPPLSPGPPESDEPPSPKPLRARQPPIRVHGRRGRDDPNPDRAPEADGSDAAPLPGTSARRPLRLPRQSGARVGHWRRSGCGAAPMASCRGFMATSPREPSPSSPTAPWSRSSRCGDHRPTVPDRPRRAGPAEAASGEASDAGGRRKPGRRWPRGRPRPGLDDRPRAPPDRTARAPLPRLPGPRPPPRRPRPARRVRRGGPGGVVAPDPRPSTPSVAGENGLSWASAGPESLRRRSGGGPREGSSAS